MKEEKHLNDIVNYWIEKAKDSLNAADDELKAGRFSFSVNRIYYACFYIASAALMKKRLRFKKHSGVRAAFHKYFIKSGLVDRNNGQFYDEIFEARQRGDYIELVNFEEEQIKTWLQQAREFFNTIRSLIVN